jgi:hypothetical protein
MRPTSPASRSTSRARLPSPVRHLPGGLALSLLVLLGCDFSAGTKVTDDTDTAAAGGDDAGADEDGSGGDEGTGGDGGTDGATDGGGTDGGGDPDAEDNDGDGVNEYEGDCDDADPSVFPGAPDACDGLDQDCDGTLDEDAVTDDDTEPNEAGYDLGTLEMGDTVTVRAALTNDDDIDRFGFDFSEGWWPTLSLVITVSELPGAGEQLLTVSHTVDGTTSIVFQESGTGELTAEFGDTVGQEDGGEWVVELSSIHGADCSQEYALGVSLDY